jgi:hypothetical protein
MNKHMSRVAKAAAVAGVGASILAGATAAADPTAPGLPKLTLGLNGHSVTVSGPLQSGAVNVVSTVSARHTEPTLIRLNPGVPFSAFAQAGAAISAHHGDLNYVNPYGSIIFDVSADEGTTSTQTTLQPGNYLAIDFSSSSPNPPNAAFTISEAAHPAALPKPGATITAIEFGFRAPIKLHDGELVRFENGGFLVHQIQGIGVKNAKAAKQLTALLLAGNDNKAQKLGTNFPEFAGPLSPGGLQQELINERPGVYLLVCIMRTQDGREHTQLGMERTIQIVR